MQHYRKSNGDEKCKWKLTCTVTDEKICFLSFKTIKFAFDAVRTIVLDTVLPVASDVLSTVSGGNLDGLISFAEEKIAQTFTDYRTCLESPDGSQPDCKSMDKLRSCVNATMKFLGSTSAKNAIVRLGKTKPT